MARMDSKQIVEQMDAFCRRHRMTRADLGEAALGDRAFYGRMTKGRDPKLSTVAKLREFMQRYEYEAAKTLRAKEAHEKG